LYHYVIQLETSRKEFKGKAGEKTKCKHFDLLMKYIKITYITIKSRIILNLEYNEITFDLFPFLFKFN
jgi:hypothetical protein